MVVNNKCNNLFVEQKSIVSIISIIG